MTNLKCGSVFLVDFDPSVGHEYKKVRPAVVVQSNVTITQTALVTVMPITSQLTNCQNEDIEIKRTDKNGLYTDSVVKAGCIHSFDRIRFLKKIGDVSDEVLGDISAYLRVHFGL